MISVNLCASKYVRKLLRWLVVALAAAAEEVKLLAILNIHVVSAWRGGAAGAVAVWQVINKDRL